MEIVFLCVLVTKKLNSINLIGREHSAVKSPFIIEINLAKKERFDLKKNTHTQKKTMKKFSRSKLFTQ